MHLLNFAGVEMCPVKNQNLRNPAVPPKISRHGHVQPGRHNVRQFMKAEGRVMTGAGFRDFPPK